MKLHVRNHQGVSNTGGKMQSASSRAIRALVALILGCVFLLAPGEARLAPAYAQQGSNPVFLPFLRRPGTPVTSSATTPVVHAPFHDVSNVAEQRFGQMAVFWFGKVSMADNSTDLRIGYNRQNLYVVLSSIDRQLWYDAASPTPGEVRNWDAASLYLALPASGQQGERQMRFDAQLSHWQPRANYQAAFQRGGSGWSRVSAAFTSETLWRGAGLNDGKEAEGWIVTYTIPFSSLGLSGMPNGEIAWKIAAAVYDQDTGSGGAALSSAWPAGFNDANPQTFASLVFGYPGYTPPPTPVAGTVTIKQGPSVTVEDGSVGGYTICGGDVNKWTGWGNKAWDIGDPSEVVVVQNQKDVSDFPCFSRYYVTFPLDAVPAGKVILSARLILHQFGGSSPSEAQRSYIQVFRVNQDWTESTLAWNNAPQAVENYPGIWVDPLLTYPGVPGAARTWDVTRALVDIYDTNPAKLRLALFSADSAMHSGKYFRASETASWNTVTPPTLVIEWGEP